MNAKSMTARPTLLLLDHCAPADDRVSEPRFDLGFDEPLRVGPQIEEPERVGGAKVGVLLREGAGIGELLDPLARAHREVVSALRADTEALGELVVAVVRTAPRARVGMGLLGLGLGRSLALDGHVDLSRVRRTCAGSYVRSNLTSQNSVFRGLPTREAALRPSAFLSVRK